mmetsp:Transcript_62754/g.198725  ORF Transcript_62754/g.198725 Transcript_62754/m.198725 type:complete len:313 (+) Transcript_62754:347-1285(+)
MYLARRWGSGRLRCDWHGASDSSFSPSPPPLPCPTLALCRTRAYLPNTLLLCLALPEPGERRGAGAGALQPGGAARAQGQGGGHRAGEKACGAGLSFPEAVPVVLGQAGGVLHPGCGFRGGAPEPPGGPPPAPGGGAVGERGVASPRGRQMRRDEAMRRASGRVQLVRLFPNVISTATHHPLAHVHGDRIHCSAYFMMERNSPSLISPSASLSNSSIMAASSSSSTVSPSSRATLRRLRRLIFPVPSSSKSWKAFSSSSEGSRSLILSVMISRNSGNSMVPVSSRSYSDMIFLTSSFFTAKPSARIATLSSL